jgi:hypothetical protein
LRLAGITDIIAYESEIMLIFVSLIISVEVLFVVVELAIKLTGE